MVGQQSQGEVALSFRDPDGFVFRAGPRIFRCVFPHAVEGLRAFLASAFAAERIASGDLIATTPVSPGDAPELPLQCEAPRESLIVEHRPIPFPNYPYEWCPEMLQAAGSLTLDLAGAALKEGFGLKDGTPYNIMFDGPRPVFLDVLSFEPRDPLDPIWRPYSQYVQTFLYPLLANRYLGLRIDEILLSHRDGLEPERLRSLCSIGLSLRPPFLSLITLPALVSRATHDAGSQRFRAWKAKDPEEASFLMRRVFGRAAKMLRQIPRRRSNPVTRYRFSHNYSQPEMARKEAAVTEFLVDSHPRDVLDIGCNTGYFSLLAARIGARVVAIDRDPACIGELWTAAGEGHAGVLPLVVDIARPPGSCGWLNAEHLSFLERARGRFDCVLMLALVHHLIVNERAPLHSIFELVAGFTRRAALIEYIEPSDPQFQRILRGRDALHRDLTRATFEAAALRYFRIRVRSEISATRTLYVLDKASP